MKEALRNQLEIVENKPTEWFEKLYITTTESGAGIPWANMAPHPLFKNWIDKNELRSNGKTALVVGCGLGDDAIELELQGYQVTAFDVSKSAIELCKKRFPNSQVHFVQADLLKGIPQWNAKFDFVLEIFTIQALPPKYEQTLIQHVSDFVSDNGILVIVTEIQKEKRSFENGPPWLLNIGYIQSFKNKGLNQVYHTNNKLAEIGDEIHLTVFQREK